MRLRRSEAAWLSFQDVVDPRQIEMDVGDLGALEGFLDKLSRGRAGIGHQVAVARGDDWRIEQVLEAREATD